MAEGKNIVIRIINEGGSGSQKNKVDVTGQDQKKSTDVLETAVLSSVLHRSFEQLKGAVVSETKYQLNLNYSLTDNYMSKQNMNIALGILSRGYSAGVSIASGFAVGGWVGAGIAAGMEVLKLGVDIYHNYQEEAINLRKMNAQLRFNRQRAGYSLTAGSRGENR